MREQVIGRGRGRRGGAYRCWRAPGCGPARPASGHRAYKTAPSPRRTGPRALGACGGPAPMARGACRPKVAVRRGPSNGRSRGARRSYILDDEDVAAQVGDLNVQALHVGCNVRERGQRAQTPTETGSDDAGFFDAWLRGQTLARRIQRWQLGLEARPRVVRPTAVDRTRDVVKKRQLRLCALGVGELWQCTQRAEIAGRDGNRRQRWGGRGGAGSRDRGEEGGVGALQRSRADGE